MDRYEGPAALLAEAYADLSKNITDCPFAINL